MKSPFFILNTSKKCKKQSCTRAWAPWITGSILYWQEATQLQHSQVFCLTNREVKGTHHDNALAFSCCSSGKTVWESCSEVLFPYCRHGTERQKPQQPSQLCVPEAYKMSHLYTYTVLWALCERQEVWGVRCSTYILEQCGKTMLRNILYLSWFQSKTEPESCQCVTFTQAIWEIIR